MDVSSDPRDAEIAQLRQRTHDLAQANEALEREIAEHRRVEEQLRQLELESRLIIDSIPNLFSLLSATGEPELINRPILDYTGKTEEELKGWGASDLVHPDDLPYAAEASKAGIASGRPYTIVYRMRRHDGAYRWFDALHTPLRDETGRVIRWCVTVNDIDDRKHAEEALRERERNLRSIIDGIPGFIAIASPDGELLVANRQMTEYFGATVDELKPWGEYVHEADLPRVFEAFGASIASGVPFDVENRLRRADGSYRWFSSRGLPIRDSSGGVSDWYFLLTDIDDLKRTEEALAARENELRLVVDSIPGMITVFAPDGQLELVNRPVLEFFGKTLDELKHWQFSDTIHPDDRAFVLERFAAAIASGSPLISENRARRFDGEFRWLQTRNFPLKDANGRVVRWYNLLIDIDELKHAEAELRRAYDSFADAQRLSRTGSFTADVMVDEHIWSDELYRIFEFDPGTKISVHAVRAALHPADLPAFDAGFQQSVTDGTDFDQVFRIVTSSGKLKHLHASGHITGHMQDRPLFIGAIQDVTVSKVAQEALQRSAAFLTHGEAVSETGSFLWSLESDQILWSDQLHRIFGFEPGTVVTLERIGALVHPDDRPLLDDMVRRAQAGQASEYEHRLLMPDGSIKHLRFVAQAARDQDGRPEYMGTVQDVTRQKLAEAARDKARFELEHASRAMSLGVLTASIAHEVNQPLSGIITNANTCLRMLSANPTNVEGALETARRTIRDGNRASEIVTRLRELFSKKEFAAGPVDLNDATREVIALSRQELQRRRVALVADLEEELPPVTGDRVQLQQVVLNLLLNACDAMKSIDDRPRELFIRTAREEAAVRLTMRDTGVGLPPDSSGKLFGAFYTTKPDGMGIGLSVSRSIIERHRGRLWAEHNSGPGAAFSFSIPCGPAGGDPTHAAASSAPRASSGATPA